MCALQQPGSGRTNANAKKKLSNPGTHSSGTFTESFFSIPTSSYLGMICPTTDSSKK